MNYQQYLNEKNPQLRIICQTKWDYLNYSDVCNWLDDNFSNDLEGRYYGTKILLHTLYYKKKDLEKLLEYGLNEKIYGEIIKAELIANENIYFSNSELTARVNKLKKSTFFMPLLDSNKPHESGNQVIGDLVHKLNISEKQVGFHNDVTEEQLKDFNFLIFVDDCIGSGSQIKKFWNLEEIKTIRKYCNNLNIKIYYLVFVGYERSIDKLISQGQVVGVDIVVCDLLTDKNRIFSDDNIIWDKESNEIDSVRKYFIKLCNQKGINFTGFKNLDFAIILHDRLPNWSLPIFWKEMAGWRILLRRKTSN